MVSGGLQGVSGVWYSIVWCGSSMVVSGGLQAGGIRRAQFPTQLYLFASWGVGASGGHQTDIFITSKHKYTKDAH